MLSVITFRLIPCQVGDRLSLLFNPIPTGAVFATEQKPLQLGPPPDVMMPSAFGDLAFYSVRQLSELIRTGQVTSTQLTQLALSQLREYDPQLHCVITLTEELALTQAARADEEIAAGVYRGPLHGIPYGAKDLLAVRGYPTTWGANPYQDQVIDTEIGECGRSAGGQVIPWRFSLG